MIFRLEPAPKLATQLDAPKVSRCKKSGNDKLSFLSILTCPVLPYQYHQQMQGGSYQCCKVKPKNLRVKKTRWPFCRNVPTSGLGPPSADHTHGLCQFSTWPPHGRILRSTRLVTMAEQQLIILLRSLRHVGGCRLLL